MYNVLVVDDDKTVRFMLKRFKRWSLCGFTISDEASDGREALEKISSGCFDLVITDIKMPGMDGIEFLKELNVLKIGICVIFLSTHSDFNYAKQGIRFGVFDYMTKPIDDEILAESLQRAKKYLDEKNLQRGRAEEEIKMLKENLLIYYPKSIHTKLLNLLKSGSPETAVEAEKAYEYICGVFGTDIYKIGSLLEMVLFKLSEEIYATYPWLEMVETISISFITPDGSVPGNLEEVFLRYVEKLLEIVRKYELYQSDSIIRRTCEYVLNHVEEEVNLDKAAQEVFLRSDYLGKLFKKKTGRNFIDYVTMVKMEHAKFLIGKGEYKNYELSEKLKYSSTDYFCRLFKSYTGCTPSEFKRSGNT